MKFTRKQVKHLLKIALYVQTVVDALSKNSTGTAEARELVGILEDELSKPKADKPLLGVMPGGGQITTDQVAYIQAQASKITVLETELTMVRHELARALTSVGQYEIDLVATQNTIKTQGELIAKLEQQQSFQYYRNQATAWERLCDTLSELDPRWGHVGADGWVRAAHAELVKLRELSPRIVVTDAAEATSRVIR